MVLMENYGVDSRGRDYIYVSLSPQFVNDHNLTHKSTVMVEVQFLMNRASLCQMHYAVDMLEKSKNIPLVFPKKLDAKQLLEQCQTYDNK